MSTETKTVTTNISDIDSIELPVSGDDEISTGAAADSAQLDERVMALPRLLRYAMLIGRGAKHVEERLFAEIYELCPNMELAATWVATANADTGVALAAELDRQAVVLDQSELRSLADCVRLRTLPVPRDLRSLSEHRRVAKALLQQFYNPDFPYQKDLGAELEEFCFAWAALPNCGDLIVSERRTAAVNAVALGARMAAARIRRAKDRVRRQFEEEAEREQVPEAGGAGNSAETTASANLATIPENYVVVAEIGEEQLKNPKLKEVTGPLKGVINTALPLVLTPALHEVRATLMAEFPYAFDAIESALDDLVGRVTVKLRPLLLLGEPGGGKSRFARRLGELIGIHVWRTDASRSDGAIFAGTDKRWYSAEPSHPFLAINRAKHANPLILLDELEKAGTRSDYGRLWDCLLAFLEPETNQRYPDPALQIDTDLSHVSYIATANSLDPLPGPIRDRFRVVNFPKPTQDDLDALLPGVIADLALQRGLDGHWISPLDGIERAAVERHWNGGSVRRLHRVVQAVLQSRDSSATRN